MVLQDVTIRDVTLTRVKGTPLRIRSQDCRWIYSSLMIKVQLKNKQKSNLENNGFTLKIQEKIDLLEEKRLKMRSDKFKTRNCMKNVERL